MYKKIFNSLVLLILISLFNSCNDAPTEIGSELLVQDEIQVLKLDSATDSMYQESNVFKKVYSLSAASEIYLGKSENLTSHLLLKFVFALPDSVKEDIKNNRIDVLSSWVELIKVYSFGDSSANYQFESFKINEPWSSNTFTSDSLQFLSIGNTNLSSNFQIKNDSLYSFNLDNGLVSGWLLNHADTSKETNDGILVSPTNNTNKILGFIAYNITATNDPRLKVIISKPGVFTDTITGFISSDLSAIVGNLPDVGEENIAVQSGLSAHSKLFFDLSKLTTNIVINSAKLILTSDSVLTKLGIPASTLLRVYSYSDSSANLVNSSLVSSLSKSGNTYSGDVTNIIRAIINGTDNQGLLIKSQNDLEGVDLYVFKGSNASEYSERPKLEILYSRKK